MCPTVVSVVATSTTTTAKTATLLNSLRVSNFKSQLLIHTPSVLHASYASQRKQWVLRKGVDTRPNC